MTTYNDKLRELLESPKAHILKRKYEIRLNVIVAKAEKSCEINIRSNPKYFE